LRLVIAGAAPLSARGQRRSMKSWISRISSLFRRSSIDRRWYL
jgi:hypothetical protein